MAVLDCTRCKRAAELLQHILTARSFTAVRLLVCVHHGPPIGPHLRTRHEAHAPLPTCMSMPFFRRQGSWEQIVARDGLINIPLQQ